MSKFSLGVIAVTVAGCFSAVAAENKAKSVVLNSTVATCDSSSLEVANSILPALRSDASNMDLSTSVRIAAATDCPVVAERLIQLDGEVSKKKDLRLIRYLIEKSLGRMTDTRAFDYLLSKLEHEIFVAKSFDAAAMLAHDLSSTPVLSSIPPLISLITELATLYPSRFNTPEGIHIVRLSLGKALGSAARADRQGEYLVALTRLLSNPDDYYWPWYLDALKAGVRSISWLGFEPSDLQNGYITQVIDLLNLQEAAQKKNSRNVNEYVEGIRQVRMELEARSQRLRTKDAKTIVGLQRILSELQANHDRLEAAEFLEPVVVPYYEGNPSEAIAWARHKHQRLTSEARSFVIANTRYYVERLIRDIALENTQP